MSYNLFLSNFKLQLEQQRHWFAQTRLIAPTTASHLVHYLTTGNTCWVIAGNSAMLVMLRCRRILINNVDCNNSVVILSIVLSALVCYRHGDYVLFIWKWAIIFLFVQLKFIIHSINCNLLSGQTKWKGLESYESIKLCRLLNKYME